MLAQSVICGPAGKLVFDLFAALTQFERELLRERTMVGLDAARARGPSSSRKLRTGAVDCGSTRSSWLIKAVNHWPQQTNQRLLSGA
jgi:DNA invertase Pin-like site-specific DNA recombinase